jgi:hypothetical protein
MTAGGVSECTGAMQLPQSLARGVRRGLPHTAQGGPYNESR